MSATDKDAQCFEQLGFVFESDTGHGVEVAHPTVHSGKRGIFCFGGLLRFSHFFQVQGSGGFEVAYL